MSTFEPCYKWGGLPSTYFSISFRSFARAREVIFCSAMDAVLERGVLKILLIAFLSSSKRCKYKYRA